MREDVESRIGRLEMQVRGLESSVYRHGEWLCKVQSVMEKIAATQSDLVSFMKKWVRSIG